MKPACVLLLRKKRGGLQWAALGRSKTKTTTRCAVWMSRSHKCCTWVSWMRVFLVHVACARALHKRSCDRAGLRIVGKKKKKAPQTPRKATKVVV